MANNKGVNTRAWRELRAEVLRTSNICGICGDPIDLSLPGTHRDGPTVNHIVSRHHGGQAVRSNLEPAHNRCNAGLREKPHGFVKTRDW